METYEARIEHRPADMERGFVEGKELRYTAENDQDAVTSFLRFWADRRDQLPDIFGQLKFIRVTRWTAQPIDAEGRYMQPRAPLVFEWKVPAFAPLDQTVAHFIERGE